MTDLDLRRRAVRALGEAGDVRALDTLLRIAGDDAHPTRAEAAEALGHLGRSPKADEILGLLRRLAAGGGPAADNALKGLRWFGGREAWDLIRKRAADRTFAYRQTATELLGHDDTPASRELLMNLLSRDGNLSVAAAAWKAAERLWGTESLEPDYAWLRNPLAERAEKGDSLKRLAERGDPARMFALFGEAPDRIRASVAESLLNRREPPLAEARAALGSNYERTVRLAARLLGRSGSGQPSAASDAKAVAAALTRWRGEWDVRRETAARTGQADPRLAERTTQCVEALVWAAGRLGGSADELAAVASAHRGSRPWRGVRMRAVEALAALQAKGLTKAALDTLEDLALTGDPEVRGPAAEAVAKADAKRGAALAGKMMADRPGFARLSAVSEIDLSPAAVAAAAKPAEQGLALPVLIRRRDVRTLSAIASDKSAQAPARLGAVEALAVLAGEPDAGGDAEAVLKKIGAGATGTSPDEEEFRKAVWRAVRRSQRTRKGGAKAPATTATAAGEAKR
jgi:ParB family chromosome partitioning protein